MKSIYLIILFIPSLCFSYVINRNEYGQELKWITPTQNIYINTANSSLISAVTLNSIFNTSAASLSSGGFTLNTAEVFSGQVNNQNDVYFTNDSTIFTGSSVLAITKVSYTNDQILEADIIINDSVNFSGVNGAGTYIGDVLTHELGHVVGLGHSEVHGSSMLYSLYNGQSTLSEDDYSGIKHLYSGGYSEITGKIIGGASVGIFGTHVMAISETDGEIKSATLSESDGSFRISGLSSSDTYFIYVKPLDTVSVMPEHFKTVRKNFCLSQSDYRGTFFQSCRRSEEGKPQGVSLASGSRDVGSISIGCDLSVPVSYMQNKPSSTNSMNIVDGLGNAGETIVGYYSDIQAAAGNEDEYEIDLRDYVVPAGDIYLEIKLVSQKLSSPVKLTLSSMTEAIVFPGSAGAHGLYYDGDANPDLDVIGRINLDANAANNLFKFQITPERIEDFIVGKGLSVDSFIPSSANYKDGINFYMLIMTISKKELGIYSKISNKSYTLQDNGSCSDAPLSYHVSESSEAKSAALQELEKRKGNKDPAVLSCGTVGSPGGPSSGTGGFILAFMLGILLANSKHLIKV